MAVMDCVDPTIDHTETEQSQIYKKNILQHYRNPHNAGTLNDPTIHAKEVNPVCGDTIEVYLKIEDNIIKDIRFDAFGCSISIASASRVSDYLKGKTLDKAKSLTKEDVLKILGIPALGATRMKCAMLLANTIKQGLKEKGY